MSDWKRKSRNEWGLLVTRSGEDVRRSRDQMTEMATLRIRSVSHVRIRETVEMALQ